MNRFENLRTMVDRFLADSCTIRDLGAEPTFDRDTLTETFDAGDVVYDGRCRLRPQTAARGETGAVPVITGMYEFTVPWDVTVLKVNQTVKITSSDDPMIVDRTYRVDSVLGGSDGAYRRAVVVDTIDQADWAEVGS